MDKQIIVNTNKRYIIQSYDNNTIIIEFTKFQEIFPEEEYYDMIAHECYILDNDYEAETRAIYYYAEKDGIQDGTQYLKYREDPTEPKLTTIFIRNMSVITSEMSFDESLTDIEDQENYDSKITAEDMC